MTLRALLSALMILVAAAMPARAEPPAVVVDLRPVAALTGMVMDGLGTPRLLVDGPSDPHSFQLRPSRARALAEADLVIWVGPQLTPWLARALGTLAPDARRLSLIEAPGTIRRAPLFAGDAAAVDPHAWLDPANATAWIGAIAAALAEADPDNAARYRANAEAARASIAATADEVAARLARAGDAPLVVAHDAFAHFADRFGLNVVDSLADGSASRPGAASVARLAARIRETGVRCLLAEAQENPALMVRLAEDGGVPLATLDPLGVLLAPGPDLYGRLLIAMADTIAGCAGR